MLKRLTDRGKVYGWSERFAIVEWRDRENIPVNESR